MRLSVLLFFCFSVCLLHAQSNIPLGTWKSYQPFNNGYQLVESNEAIIFASQGGITRIDKETLEAEFISKVEGLSNVSIDKLTYNQMLDQIIAIYDDSSFDVISSSEIIHVTDISDDQNIFGDKRISNVDVSNNFLYLASPFGLIQYNLDRLEFGFTTFTDVKVNDICSSENTLFVGTDEGLFFLDLNNAINPSDFNTWSYIGSENNLPDLANVSLVSIVNENVYTVIGSEVYRSNTSNLSFQLIETIESDLEPQHIREGNNVWLLSLRGSGTKSQTNVYDFNDALVKTITDCSNRINDAIMDVEGRLWFADDWDDIRYTNSIEGSCNRLAFNFAQNLRVSDIDIKDNELFVASGGASDIFTYNQSPWGFYMFRGANWENYSLSSLSSMVENDFQNCFQIIAHPSQSSVFIGSYWAGLMKFSLEDGSTEYYNQENSSLQGAVGDENRTRIAGLNFDRQNNLWMSNYLAEKPVSVLTSEGNWLSFNIDAGTLISEIIVDDLDYKWMVLNGVSGGGLVVYDTNGTIEDPTDDREKTFKSNNSELPTNRINAIDKDLEGNIWVGTTEGAVVFECGGSVFEDVCIGNRKSVVQDSIRAYLLETENIKTIEVDGANRKWFGTTNGIFVQSSSGEDQVFHFTESNSPLPDNNIVDISFNPNNGEIFIATAKGIVSYRSKTTGATNTHSQNVFAFPNPVRPDYTGDIAIQGLAEDAEVKITDLNGKLVFETIALGGQAIWDGNDYNKIRVQSGVYLVFSSSTSNINNSDSFVSKILVLR